MLESFSAKFVDSFTNSHLGVTPYLDFLSNHGVKFVNAYANGMHSIIGIGAILAGVVPPINTDLYFGKGLESSNFSYIGSIFKKNGYHTLAMQSSNRHSFRVDSITKMAGFDKYFGAEDFKTHQHNEDKNKMPFYGTWDGDMFNRFFTEINKLQEPFLAFTFTATTHFPFYLPSKKYEIYPHSDQNLNGFLNTMYYTDCMIQDFMHKAQTAKWFKNTIFIYT